MEKSSILIPSLNTVTHEWTNRLMNRQEYSEFLESIYKIPGEFNFDSRINNFKTEADLFNEKGYYYNKPKGTREFRNYWDRQKEFCMTGMIVDDMYISGWHYMYLNFLPIKIKATQAEEFNVTKLPDFRDLDVWGFNLQEKAEADFKHTVSLKSRQKGWQQPKSTKVISEKGIRPLGDLVIGDKVYTQDGTLTEIIEIFEKGISDVYKITFQDGRSTKCGLEHLWRVFDKVTKSWKTLSSKDLIGNLNSTPVTSNGKSYLTSRYYIPENKCLLYANKELVVDPYLLGCLIGDGSLRPSGQIQLMTMDFEILDSCLEVLGKDFYLSNGETKNQKADRFSFLNKNTHNTKHNISTYGNEGTIKYGYNPLSRDIESLGLKGKTTYTKFIPEIYLTSSKEQRILLLQGLMDTDGYINANGMDIQYTTVNEQLSIDIARLCRSLGITVNVDKKIKAQESHKDYYRVRLNGIISFDIFKLKRKLERFKLRESFGQGLKRFRYCNIIKIEKLNYQEDSRCITVDHESHLYLTDDFIVTHNTIKKTVPLIRQLWFEKDKVGKILTPDEKFVKKTWSDIIETFRNHLNQHTAWYRGFNPDRPLDWKQQTEVTENGRKLNKGTGSTLLGFTTKSSPTSAVSGINNRVLIDEAGTDIHLSKIVRYLIPSLEAGRYVTGYIDICGAVGELKDAQDLKEIFYEPIANGFYGLDDIFDGGAKQIGLFVPHNWGLEGFIDKYGNSDTKGAELFIEEERLKKKKLSNRDYQIYVSQYPLRPSEAFQERELNPFPVEIIQPHYEKLCQEYEPLNVELFEKNGVYSHKLSNKVFPVEDFPVIKDTDKRGCVQIYEPPLYETPNIGIYYASCDPVTQIKTVTSESLQSFYIYRSDFYQNDKLIPGELVAWYCGRYDNVDTTYEICRKLMRYYNAKVMIESDKEGFIKWMINKKEQFFLMKRSEYPQLQEILPQSKIFEDYGIRKGNSINFVNHLLETAIRYITEEIGTDYDEEGNSKIRYGVERIRDKMLLKEMLGYNKRGNFDRIWSFCYVLNVAEGNSIRQRVQKINEYKIQSPIIPYKISQFSSKNINQFQKKFKLKQF